MFKAFELDQWKGRKGRERQREEREVKEGRKKERKGKTVEKASLIVSLWGIHPTGGQHRSMRPPPASLLQKSLWP